MIDKPYSYWDYKHWKEHVHNWIAKNRWERITWYANQRKSRKFPGFTYLMEDILHEVRIKKPNALLSSPFWNTVSEGARVGQVWWSNHVKKAIRENDENYLMILLKNDLFISVHDIYSHVGHEWSVALNNEAAKYIYRNNENSNMVITLYENNILRLQSENSKPFFLASIVNFPPNHFFVVKSDPLLNLIADCLEGKHVDILEALRKKISFKLEENHYALQELWMYLIANDIDQDDQYKEKLYKAMEYIIKSYKINLNNTYLNLRDFRNLLTDILRKERLPIQPFTNPHLWMSDNLPMIAAALMARNKRAVLFLLSLGATLKRCAFTLEDVTKDPEMLKLFHLENKATKIQRAYKTHLYNPNHPSQSKRNSNWKSLALRDAS